MIIASNADKPTLRQANDCSSAYLTSHHVGLTTDLEPLLLHYLPLDANKECSVFNSCLRRVVPAKPNAGGIPGPLFVNVSDVQANYMTMQRSHTISLDALENLVAPHGPALVDTFFAKVHPICPVLVERRFREAYDVYVNHRSRRASAYHAAIGPHGRAVREEITPALLAAVYLLSLPYLDATCSSASSPVHGYAYHDLGRPNAARLKALTSQLLTESLAIAQTKPILATLQAGVLAAQHHGLNTPSLNSQLISLVYDLGLHSDCGHWEGSGIGYVERGLRRRLAWSVYVLDKWGAIVHGRPSLIQKDEWDVPELRAVDFSGAYIHSQRVKGTGVSDNLDELKDKNNWEIPEEEIHCDHSVQSLLFSQTVSLTRILSSILTTFYTASAINKITRLAPSSSPPSMRTRVVLEMAKPIQLRLKEWYAGLPTCLRMESQLESPDMPFSTTQGSGGGDGFDRGPFARIYTPVLSGLDDDGIDRSLNGTLHLAYFAAEITLHRVIIRSLAVYTPTDDVPGRPPDSMDGCIPEAQRDDDAGDDDGFEAVATTIKNSGSGIDTAPAPVPIPANDPDQYLIYICRSAAKTRLISALDFTNRLRPQHLTSPWPFYARSCLSLVGSFGLLLRITAATKGEVAFYAHRVGEYLWTLSVSEAQGGSWISWAGERVRELVEAACKSKLPEKPEFVEPIVFSQKSELSRLSGQSYVPVCESGEITKRESYRYAFTGSNADPGDTRYISNIEDDIMDNYERAESMDAAESENENQSDEDEDGRRNAGENEVEHRNEIGDCERLAELNAYADNQGDSKESIRKKITSLNLNNEMTTNFTAP
ncbi:Fungal specific transcription factor, partial [Ascosphaera aggregata]